MLGLVAFPYRGAYVASKFALEGLADTLRLELCGSGIAVCPVSYTHLDVYKRQGQRQRGDPNGRLGDPLERAEVAADEPHAEQPHDDQAGDRPDEDDQGQRADGALLGTDGQADDPQVTVCLLYTSRCV